MPLGYEYSFRSASLGKKPHLLVGTMMGTLAAYVAFFRHYTAIADDSETWVWFGIRSDGRCGRDFAHEATSFLNSGGDTMCGKGQCCSSHGWCGHGEEYCSVSMGCQSNCWPANAAETAKRDADASYREQAHDPDDDEYMDRMHRYRYDEDEHGDHYHRRHGGYGGHGAYHHDYHHNEYHHRYDADDHAWGGHDGHEDGERHGDDGDDGHGFDEHHEQHHDSDEDARYDSDEPHPSDYHPSEHHDPSSHGHPADQHDAHAEAYGDDHGQHVAAEGEADKGPELVGLEEAKHLGHGDGVPLHGEAADPTK